MSKAITQNVSKYDGNEIVSSFLDSRGLGVKDIDYLLNPDISHQHDPFLLRGIDNWIDELHKLKGEVIAVMPDFDTDGVTSGTIARVGLYLFGFGHVYVYPPQVFDGYGLTSKSIDDILKAQPDTTIIITTDNGSNAYDGVVYANSKGIKVFVTDHHISHKDTAAHATVNPSRRLETSEELYPFVNISGATVIYKVLLAYGLRYETDEQIMNQYRDLIFLVGVSVISDVMPVLDENRYYVKEAINMFERLNDSYSEERLSLYSDNPLDQYYRGVDLLTVTLNKFDKLKYGIDGDTFGFTIGPILNSPRRMSGKSALAFDLFQTKRDDVLDPTKELVSETLYNVNEQRKTYTRGYTEALHGKVADDIAWGIDPIHYTVFNSVVNAGVSGLLAGSFTNKYNLPSVSFAVPEKSVVGQMVDPINVDVNDGFVMSGSARSPDYFNLHTFLTNIDKDYPDLIITWGGHPQAAGITIDSSNFNLFRSIFVGRLAEAMAEMESVVAGQIPPLPIHGEYVITSGVYRDLVETHPKPDGVSDVEVSDTEPIHRNQMIYDSLAFFDELAPYGNSFMEPSFSVMFKLGDASTFQMGADKQHVKYTLPNQLAIINWNGSDFYNRNLSNDRVIVVTGTLGINDFRGKKTLQIIARDIIEL